MCDLVGPDLVEFDSVLQFFEEKWAPTIVTLHTPGGGTLSSFLSELCLTLHGLKIQE